MINLITLHNQLDMSSLTFSVVGEHVREVLFDVT